MVSIPPPVTKYDFSGIGNASAAALMAVFLVNPSTTFLTAGIAGKLVYYIASQVFAGLASVGLVFLNVGAEQIATAVSKAGFDGSLDNAYKVMDQLTSSGHGLTAEEVAEIDNPVISQFEKFAKLTRTKS